MENGCSDCESVLNPEPRDEHRWLQQLVGEWTYEAEAVMAPGGPATKFQGTESVHSLGNLWVVAEGEGGTPAGGATTRMTLGYDLQKRQFVGTWVGSMMTILWVYEGELDGDKAMLTLRAEIPAGDGTEKVVRFKDVIRLLGDDHRTLTAYMEAEDGEWRELMTTHYRRKS